MARRANEIPTDLVPLDEVAFEIGFAHAPGIVRKRLQPEDIYLNWRRAECVSPDKARQLVDEFAEAAPEGERITAERQRAHEERQEREAERARKEAAASRPPAGERILHGVRTLAPGESEPGWANEEP